jgi:hypothetical protein
MSMDILRRRLILEFVFECHVGSRPFLIVESDAYGCGVGDGIVFEENGLEFGGGNLESVDFDEFLCSLSVY